MPEPKKKRQQSLRVDHVESLTSNCFLIVRIRKALYLLRTLSKEVCFTKRNVSSAFIIAL